MRVSRRGAAARRLYCKETAAGASAAPRPSRMISPMHDLTPGQLDAFLARFRHGEGGRLRGVEARTGRGGLAVLAFTLELPDAEDGDDPATVRLELGGVAEMRLQVRPTEDPTELADGLTIGRFNDLYYVDLQPWTDQPSGVHDYRASSCYAAGFTLRWDLLDESEHP